VAVQRRNIVEIRKRGAGPVPMVIAPPLPEKVMSTKYESKIRMHDEVDERDS
jgi:hypothetical protein